MKPIICHIITRMIQGGADENTLYSCNSQVNAGYKVYLLIGEEYEPEILQKLDNRIEVIRIKQMKRKISFINDILAAIKIYNFLRKKQPHIVHTHTSKAGILGRLAAYLANIKIIIHGVHILPFINVSFFERILYLKIERIISKTTDCFINVSEGMQLCCLTHGIGVPEQHHVVKSGMDIEKFRSAGQSYYDWREIIEENEIKIEKPRFITIISRLESRKGQLDFLQIFKKLISVHKDIVLLLVGNGEDYQKIYSEIIKLGLNERVILTGRRDDVEQIISLSEVCILSSKREGLPRVLIQYLAVNRPILTTECEGLENLIEHERNAYIVKEIKSKDTIYYLDKLLSSQELRKRMVGNNANLDLEKWNTKTMANELDQIYNSLLIEKQIILANQLKQKELSTS